VRVKPSGGLDAQSRVALLAVDVEIFWKAPVAPLTEGLVKPTTAKVIVELALT
jgi:hypothetical protein